MAQAVAYADLTNLSRDLTAIAGGSFKTNTRALIASTLAQVEYLAEAYAPRRTGHLKGSITSYPINGGMGGVIKAQADYASFVEFGTGTRGEFPGQAIIIRPRTGQYLRFRGRDGRIHYAKQVINPGMAPRPFLRPAIERVILPLADALGDSAVLSIIKGPKAPETLLHAPATGWN